MLSAALAHFAAFRPPAARFAVAMRRPYSSASLRLLALAAPLCRPGSHVDRSCRPAAASTRHTLPALTCECSRYPCSCTPVPCHRSPSLVRHPKAILCLVLDKTEKEQTGEKLENRRSMHGRRERIHQIYHTFTNHTSVTKIPSILQIIFNK